jgi:hypothetical protein
MKKSTLQDSQPVQVWNNALQSKALPFALIMTSNFFFLKVKKIFRKYTVQLYFNIIII